MEKENNSTKKLTIILICVAMLACIVFAIAYFMLNGNTNNSSADTENVEVIENSTNLSLEYTSDEILGVYKEYKAKINLNDLSVDGSGVQISGTTITINTAGTYYFTGTANEANIIVNASNQEVVLVFNNANITCSTTSVINVVKAKKVTINLPENSVNTFTDSNNYTSFTDDDEPDSCIFSKADLSIDGKGKLIINANYKDGIASKDTLKIINAELEIISKDDGICGKDYVGIKDAIITIKSSGDGIKSTNSEDTSLGFIQIDGGKITIESENDSIQAETVLSISNTNITIKTTGQTQSKTNTIFYMNNSSKQSATDSVSSKGLKAGTEITINSGSININSTDDSIHSNKYIIINGGDITISSGDDGMHADNNIIINNGNISITKSYEGIESNYIRIEDGNISVISSDDGINISGGNDNSSLGRQGANSFSYTSGENRLLIINSGNIYVNSDGDGLDSNGSIQINGGTIEVAGSTNGGNGALDYDSKCTVNGGNLIIYGATGMWQNPSSDSKQYSIAFSTTGKVGDTIVLKDSDGNEIVSFTAKKAYGMICISNENLTKGKTYTLYVNGVSVGSQEITSIVTSNGNNSGGNMGGGMINRDKKIQ